MEYSLFETLEVRALAEAHTAAFQAWRAAGFKDQPTEKAMCDALRALLVAHPFAKVRSSEHETPLHTFEVTGFSCDVWAFRKWLKTPEGCTLKSRAGGVSDDGLYTLSALLREVLPRGLHILTATHRETGNVTTFAFRGIPKFSGLVASDEDEESHAEAAMFFFDGHTLDDVTEVYVTEKSNGENAKLGLRRLDGELYLLAGSKQTCHVWPASESFAEICVRAEPLKAGEPEPHPSRTIAELYERWYRGLGSELQARLEEDVFGHCQTIVAEVNRPWAEHLVPIAHLFMECYSLIGPDHRPIPPEAAFAALRSVGMRQVDEEGFEAQEMRHVKRRREVLKAAADLTTLSTQCRRVTDSEGAVLYLLAPARANGAAGGGGSAADVAATATAADSRLRTVGLVKVKTNSYVYRRRMRETIKSVFFRSLMAGEVRGLQAMASSPCKQSAWQRNTLEDKLERVRRNISLGLANLTHVPDCATRSDQWVKFGLGFVRDYLLPKWDQLFGAAQRAARVTPIETVAQHLQKLPALAYATGGKFQKATPAHGPIYAALHRLHELFRSKYASMLVEYEATLVAENGSKPAAAAVNGGAAGGGGGSGGSGGGGSGDGGAAADAP